MDMKLRKKFGVKLEWVIPFAPIPIIEIPGYSTLSAVRACDEFQVKKHTETEKLKKAKKEVYLDGFYKGVFIIPEWNGVKVQDAKEKIRQQMLDSGEAEVYWEPEGKVVSRSGDVCVVTFCDQWFFKYSDTAWKRPVQDYVSSDQFECFFEIAKHAFEKALDWVAEWGLSRNYGLGTKVPWDEQFVIESLSDSTIYMAYYTISHFMQGDPYGATAGSLGISHKDMSYDCWDYIFGEAAYDPSKMAVPESKLETCKNSFNYWYPMDLRVSAKDLIRNHLIFSLLHHAAIWQERGTEMLPRGFFCNGMVAVNGGKYPFYPLTTQ